MIGLLIFTLFFDGAGYIYRITNHYPLTGSVPGLPPHFGDSQIYLHRGLDLNGGSRIEYQMKGFPPGRTKQEVQAQTIDVIKKRVDALGVAEPIVQGEGQDRIIVELAGVSSDRAAEVIGKTAKLITTIWVKDANSKSGPEPGYKPQISPLSSDMVTNASAQLDQNGVAWTVQLTFNSQGSDIFGKLTTTAFNACSTSDCPERHIAEWLNLTPEDIARWDEPGFSDQVSAPTSLNGKLLTNPVIQQAITGGTAVISGGSPGFTQQSAKDLATQLNSGALPVTLDQISSLNVGASLGAQAVRQSLAAGGLGLLIVIIFMIAYYRLPGLLASIALIFYGLTVLALYKAGGFVLSLPGIAGFILSVGMAVDANVLIFERFKEEVRGGRTIGAAVDASVRRAWPAIRDSNTSTMITSLVLYLATPAGSPVKGFALTLFLGVLVSLISSIVVTHNLLAIVLNFSSVRRGPVLGVERSGRAA